MTSYFTRLELEGVMLQEQLGAFVLVGMDEATQTALRNFLDRPATLTIEPLDTQDKEQRE